MKGTESELWRELGANMRRLRNQAALSLRAVEVESGWTRGTLSQVENGKAKPNPALVLWYDERLHADGLLLSLFTEASASAVPTRPRHFRTNPQPTVTDFVRVVDTQPIAGERVAASSEFEARWLLGNVGRTSWHDRHLARVGAVAGTRVIGSSASVQIAPTRPGDVAEIRCVLRAPDHHGTYVAYWQVVDADGAVTGDVLVPMLVVV